MRKKLIAFLFVGLMVTTALAVLPTMAAAEKKFEGQNLDWIGQSLLSLAVDLARILLIWQEDLMR